MIHNRLDTASDIRQVLGLEQPTTGHKRLWLWVLMGMALALITAVVALLTLHKGSAYQFKTAAVQRGDLIGSKN